MHGHFFPPPPECPKLREPPHHFRISLLTTPVTETELLQIHESFLCFNNILNLLILLFLLVLSRIKHLCLSYLLSHFNPISTFAPSLLD